MNIKKTTYINFHPRRPLNFTALNNVPFSPVVRFLGVMVDQNLNFQNQVENVCGKLNKAYFALLKLKSCLVESSLMQAYYALCYSHLSYCILVWGGAVEWRRVFIAQKRIVRLLFGLGGRETCRDSFRLKSLLTFPSIFILKAVTYVKQHIQEFGDTSSPYNTRNNYLPNLQHRSALFERGPCYSFVRLYNKLPNDLRLAGGIKQFKCGVKKLLLGKAYYSQQEYLADNL